MDASPDALAALDAAPARGPASRAVADRLARLTAKGRAKVDAERAAAARPPPRLELAVDGATWARQLRLVTDDPERIARALASGAARAVSGLVGGPALAAAGLLMPAAAAAAAGGGGAGGTPPPRRATATLPVPPRGAPPAAGKALPAPKKAAAVAAAAAPAPSATATVTVAAAAGGKGGKGAATPALSVKRRLLVLRAASAAPASHAVTTTPVKPTGPPRPASPFDSLEASARPLGASAGPSTPRGASGFLQTAFGGGGGGGSGGLLMGVGGSDDDDCRAIVPSQG